MRGWVIKLTYDKIVSKESNKLHLESSYISSLKQHIKSLNTSNNPFKKTLYFTALFLWRLLSIPYRFLFKPDYRSLVWLKYGKGHETHQISNYTEYNRYPDLFLKCQELMKGKKNLKILSYGCSTGEEVFTLREYFPDAFIVGVDINKRNIKKAISQNKDHNIIFSYDIEKTFNSSTIYPFEKFNAKLTKLNSHLKSNGLFVIDHADYLFEDSDIARSFHDLKGDHTIVHERYLFDKHNRKMSDYVMSHRIFIKNKFESFDSNS